MPPTKSGAKTTTKPRSRAPERTATPAPRRIRPNEEFPLPLGGRMWVVLGLLAVMVAFPFTPLAKILDRPPKKPVTDKSQWAVGRTAKVRITVVTADFGQLECASDANLDGKHCEYKTQTEHWPTPPDAPLDDNKKNIIQPYRTATNNQLLLIAGFWAQPEVAMRLHKEPPTGIASNQLARFIVECNMKFIGHIANPTLRWSTTQSWGTEKENAFVAVPEDNSCHVFGPDEDS